MNEYDYFIKEVCQSSRFKRDLFSWLVIFRKQVRRDVSAARVYILQLCQYMLRAVNI